MKKKKLILFILFPLLLTSCSKNKNAILVLNNADYLSDSSKTYISVNGEEITYMMKAQSSFILFEYDENCSYCKDTSNNFVSYLKDKPYTIYSFSPALAKDYIILNEYDNINFPSQIVTPRVLVINEGKVVDEIARGKLYQEKLFPSAINSFTNTNSHLYTCTTLKGYNYMIEKNNDINVVLYNTKTLENIDIYLNICNDKQYKEDTLFIDTNIADEDLLEYLN